MIPSGFSEALHLLIILCKPQWSKEDIADVEKYAADGTTVFQLAERHRVTPLVWSRLKEIHIFSLEVRSHFKLAAQQNQFRAMQTKALEIKLSAIQTAFGIKGFFLKGLSIAERFYSDMAERHVLDIDWFVDEKGILPLTKEIMNLGYVPVPNVTKFHAAQWKYYIATHHDVYLTPPENSGLPPIELHWRLRSPWGSFTLGPETKLESVDEFLYLCVHGTEHGWFRLKWLMDLPRFIEKSKLDWERVWERAVKYKCQKQLSISLLVLDQLSIFGLPMALKEKINASSYVFELEYIYHAIKEDKSFNENDLNRWNYFKYLWRFRAKKWNPDLFKIFLTSPNDWETIKLPRVLFFLYFPMRPFLWLYRRLKNES